MTRERLKGVCRRQTRRSRGQKLRDIRRESPGHRQPVEIHGKSVENRWRKDPDTRQKARVRRQPVENHGQPVEIRRKKHLDTWQETSAQRKAALHPGWSGIGLEMLGEEGVDSFLGEGVTPSPKLLPFEE